MVLSRLAALAPLAFLLLATDAFAQVLPPRSVSDILAVLEAHKPDPAKIRQAREAAVLERPSTDDRLTLKRFYLARAEARGNLGMVKDQVSDFEKALELTRPRDGDAHLIKSQLMFAATLADQRTRAFEMARELPQLAAGPGDRLAAHRVLVGFYAVYGDFSSARKNLAAAEAAFDSVSGDRTMHEYFSHFIESARHRLALNEGNFDKAEAHGLKALQHLIAFRKVLPHVPATRVRISPLTMERIHTMIEYSVGQTQQRMGKLVEAELTVRNLLTRTLGSFGKHSPDAAAALAQLASVVFEQGRFDDAGQLARAATEIYGLVGAAPATYFRVEASRILASAHVERGAYAEAAEAFARRRQAIETDAEYAERVGWEDPLWAYALVRLGRAEPALEMTRRQYDRARERWGEAFYPSAEARAFLALALAAKGAREEALLHFRAAIPILLEDARIGRQGEAFAKSRRLERLLEAYVGLLADLHATGAAPHGLDPAAEAFRIADVIRSSRVQLALSAASARAAIRDSELAKLAREAQDASHRIGSLTSILLDLLSRKPDQQLPQVVAAIRSDVEQLRKRRVELRTEIDKRFPDYANLIEPKPVTLEGARNALRPGESLVALLGTSDRTLVWAIPHSGAPAFATVALGAQERDQIVSGLRRALDVGAVPLREIPAFNVLLAHRLYREILAPVEAGWKGATSLLVVPHAELGQLPFALLPTAPAQSGHAPGQFDGYRKVPWLARDVAIAQLPSVNALVTLRGSNVARAPARPYAGFGDPVFAREARPPVAVASRSLGLRNLSAILRRESKQIDSAQLAQLPRLPDTADEVVEIGRTLNADGASDVFLGPQASEKKVKTTDLSDRRVIVFATHGLVPGELDGLSQPALAMANPEVTGDKDDDGLLSADEIVSLRLNADWVVLSACNTAAGEGAGAESVSGLGRAFFYAGARALLVSNWPVESASARRLTTDLFARQAREPGLARAEALRRSMLALMDEGKGSIDRVEFSYAHPMFWAPFTLVGDGAAR